MLVLQAACPESHCLRHSPATPSGDLYPKPDEPEANRDYDMWMTNEEGGNPVGAGNGGTILGESAWGAVLF
jgi:hypothetical protein